MKNIFIKSIAILAAAFVASGCVKETFPAGSTLTQEQLAQSELAISYMANGIPASMMASGTGGYLNNYSAHYDFGIPALHMATDFMCEDITPMGDLGYCWFSGWLQNRVQGADYTYAGYFWQLYFQWIKLANDIIGAVGTVDENTSSETLKYLGQAHAYRASFYLDAARLYEPKRNNYTDVENVLGLTVPIVTEKTTEAMAKINPRAERTELYEFIFSDLALAETYLADVPASYTAPSLPAIYGLYARAYLELGAAAEEDGVSGGIYDGAYQKAAEYARKAIDASGCTPLTEDQWHDPNSGFCDGGANNSWIWGLTLSTENAVSIITSVAHLATEATWGYSILSAPGISKALYEAIDDDDFRKRSFLDPDYTWMGSNHDYRFAGSADEQDDYIHGSIYFYGASPYENIKFRPAAGEVTDYTVGNCADHVLMRVEEMYFIEMEAVLHTKGVSQAQELLNDFMQTYRYKSYDCSGNTGSKSSFLKEMLLQKRIEFWGEGIVMYDYKRLNMGITRGYKDTNFPSDARFNTTGRSPQWNIVISRLEYQSNVGVTTDLNNPDPTEVLIPWRE